MKKEVRFLTEVFVFSATITMVTTFLYAYFYGGRVIVDINGFGEAKLELVMIAFFVFVMIVDIILRIQEMVKE